jgi:hypothetical protein
VAGIRSLLAQWLGGAGAQSTQAGVRSLLARWIGGASSELFAFWAGGATATAVVPEPEPEPETPASAGGGGGSWLGSPIQVPTPVRGALRVRFRVRVTGHGTVHPAPLAGTVALRGALSLRLRGTVDNRLPRQIAEEDELLLVLMQ